jgi:HTH-type transcriptional regulator/antitoxin HigA
MGTNPRPACVPPPGRTIKRELEARVWTQKDLAHIMDRPEQFISQLVNAHKRITPETALQLADAFGTSADLWLNMEASYQLYQARQERDNPDIARRSRLYSLVPLTEIRRRGWIVCGDSLEEMEQAVCDFLGISTPTEIPRLAVSFRQSSIGDAEVAAEIAWVRRVEHLARAQTMGDFDRERLRAALPDLLAYSAEAEGVKQVPTFLHQLGVHFVIVPHLSKTYLDGAAFRLNAHPVVALTLRYERIDNFWFTLMHELGHIIADHEGGYLDNLEEPAESPEEKEANRLARDWLIDPDDLARFIQRTQPYFSHEKIRAFAASQTRHPGIVVGRLQHDEAIDYNHSRGFLVKVRSHLEEWIDVPEPA